MESSITQLRALCFPFLLLIISERKVGKINAWKVMALCKFSRPFFAILCAKNKTNITTHIHTKSKAFFLYYSPAPDLFIADENLNPLYERHYDVNSTLELYCYVRNIEMTSSVVLWIHNDKVLNYDAVRGGIRWEKERDTHNSCNISGSEKMLVSSYLDLGKIYLNVVPFSLLYLIPAFVLT